MRLIDADAFDERVRAAGGMSEEELSEDFKDGVLAVLYMMSKQPTITAQQEQRWIPCSEGLPEVHETGNSFSGVYMQSYPVLVYGVPEGEEECGFHVVTYCDDLNGYTYWSTELDAVTIDGVRAWMPLPEPYAERREE